LPDQARRVLESVGSGDRTYAAIASSAGGAKGPLASGSLSPLLRQLLEDKQVIAADLPLSTQPGKPALYRIADSNLRLYLASLRSTQELVRRGRPEAAYRLFERRWTTWRGRAVEPVVRESLELAAISGSLPWRDAEAVGGWWNRRFDPEVDIVGGDRSPVARRLFFAGSIKWLGSPFDRHDLNALRRAAAQVPGFEPDQAGLTVVSMSGVSPGLNPDDVEVVWGPRDVISAWESA
jgi:uncharacterized protein